MVKVKEESLEVTLIKAIQSLKSSETRLVSYTKEIDTIDPIELFKAGEQLRTNRAFWKSSLDDFTLVGFGTVFSLVSEKAAAKQLEAKWNDVLRNAFIYNPYQTPGTGINAIGGMAFDPLQKQSDLWRHFATSELRIPEFTLIKDKGSCYVTITTLVSSEDNPSEIYNQLKRKEEMLYTQQNVNEVSLHIEEREAIQPEEWKRTVQKATSYITEGHAKKIVLARELRLTLSNEADIAAVLEGLVETQSTSYIFAFEQGNDCFIGASPERLVKVEQNQLLSTCLAGTAPRGQSTEEDEKIGYALLHDEKNLQEHDFVVQMIKTSIAKFCDTIQVPDKPVLYKLRNLQHLYTPVRGGFKAGSSIFNVVEALHPTPALGGEPREAALAFIREEELLERGWYGAPIGWIDSNQNGEFAVAIRSGLIQGNQASLFAGCGVVADSDPEAEFEETSIKFLPMLTVLGG
ncbi:isochorismate synthase [Ornithinibacillus contaminans]|uniref:isochorismate synthase n=1 Tax=Ornithinibacillus contaminans TaxID=694055 RepID=UPI00064DD24D|nr:isochorismate synthase [Ornithinibacillus contaminans]